MGKLASMKLEKNKTTTGGKLDINIGKQNSSRGVQLEKEDNNMGKPD